MLFYLQVFVQSLPKEMLLTVLTVDALPSANTNCYTKPVLNKGRRVDVCTICTYMVGMKEMSTCFNSKSQVIFPMNPSYLENHFRTSFVKKKEIEPHSPWPHSPMHTKVNMLNSSRNKLKAQVSFFYSF